MYTYIRIYETTQHTINLYFFCIIISLLNENYNYFEYFLLEYVIGAD
jgi:hypothetical protein